MVVVSVMAGLGPAICAATDGRVEPGHDDQGLA